MRLKAALATTAGLSTVMAMVLFSQTASAEPIADDRPAQRDPVSVAVAAADRAVANGLDALRRGVDENYSRRNVTTGPHGTYYISYDRTYRGLPVIGGDAVVVADASGRVKETHAASGPTRAVSTRARVSAAAALAKSKRELSRVDDTADPRLVILAWGAQPILAWESVVTGIDAGGKPSIKHVFVNAHTGAVADSYDLVHTATGDGYYNGTVEIDTASSSMSDPTRSGIRCGGQNGSTYTGSSPWGNGSGTNLETACVDALYAVQQEWDMLGEWLGRNGINGNGGGFPARVGLNDVNAYWNGSYTNFGHSQDGQRQATPMDVVGHEFGHAIFQTTPGGSNSQNGINESTGDIFGALTEAYANNSNDPPDYLVGEEVDLVGNGPIRNMYNPSARNHPNCYSSSIPNTEVHAAAGPLNHWFYLVAEGSNPSNGNPDSPICSGGPSSVTGIGIQKAGQVYMGALNRKTSGWRWTQVRSAAMASVVDLFGTASQECRTVKGAWDAVSVPEQSGEPQCSTAPDDDFSMSLNPTSGSVDAGQSATSTVGTQTTSGSSQTVNLSASGLPSGATASFNPSSVTSGNSSTMTIATSSSTPSGTYQVTVTGSGQVTHSVTFTLTVNGDGPGPGTPPDIDVENVKAHLQQFQNFADSNGGNRRSTGGGYDDSADYVFNALSAAGYNVVRQNCTSGCTSGAGPNVIADWPGGDANSVYMFGAHLDGVSAGPGINDNGSGSAVLLEVALELAEQNPTMLKHVRFGWWTDEEQGLNGSQFYVDSLSSTELSRIDGYFNFDMVASTNYGYFLDNINGTLAGYLKDYFDSRSIATEEMGECCSDDGPFRNAGVATTFLSTGASATKSSSQQQKWGGTAGRSFDPCYHASCDSYPSNISTTAIDNNADATAHALWTVAVGSGDPGSPSVTNPGSQTSTVGTADSLQMQATGGTTPYTWSGTGLPAGLSINSTSGLISGTPSSAGTSNVTVTVTDANNKSSSAGFTWTVTDGGPGGCSGTNANNVTISDFTTVESPITISGCGTTPTTAAVEVHIVHTYIGDLTVSLVAPDGSAYVLHNRGGGSADDINQTYTVNLAGESADGTWNLRVQDSGPQDVGHIDSWTLDLSGDGGPGPGGCADYDNTDTGSLTSGQSGYTDYFYVGAGLHEGCLDGPDGVDFDLYLQQWNGFSWANVASGTSPGPDETLSYNGSAGYYRYRVHAYSGSGSLTLGWNTP